MSENSLSHRIIRNTVFNAAGRVWGMLAAFILTPYIIHRIGPERFGILAVAGVFTGYFGLFDFGVGTSFVKYISEFHIKRDPEKINQVINTGIFFYGLFAIAVLILAGLLVQPLVVFLKVPPYLRGEAGFVFFLGIVFFGISNIVSVFGAVLFGLQRMDIVNKAAICVSVLNALGTVFFLKKGYGLAGLMINNGLTLAVSSIINIIIAFRIFPGLKLAFSYIDKAVFKKLFNFGSKLQISYFANLVSFHTDKLLISYFLGVGLVAFYQLASSLLQQIRQVPLFLISALVPAVSEITAKDDKENLKRLYLSGSKFLILVSAPLTVFVIAMAPLIISAWMGEGYGLSAAASRILAAGYFAATITGVASSISAGSARTGLDMKFGLLMAALNLFLSVYLVIKIGFIGVVLGTAVSLTVASVFYIRIFSRYFGYSMGDFARLLWIPLCACVAPFLGVLAFNHLYGGLIMRSGRLFKLGAVGAAGIFFMSVYAVCVILSGYLDEYEKGLIRDKVPFLRRLF